MTFDVNDMIGLAGVPVIVALVQVTKPWVADERVYPLLSIGFGLLINGGLALARGGELMPAVLAGVVAGLAASGLYTHLKHADVR